MISGRGPGRLRPCISGPVLRPLASVSQALRLNAKSACGLFVLVPVRMAVSMRVIVRMAVCMAVARALFLLAMVNNLFRTRAARVFIEDKRLDRDWNCERGHAHLAKVDIIKVNPRG